MGWKEGGAGSQVSPALVLECGAACFQMYAKGRLMSTVSAFVLISGLT